MNNIDDIFKEGLAEYSEQPSKGLWNKISGKLLRYELFRLNFTNVPKLWVGLAAAGVVAVSLFVFNPFTSGPGENTLTSINQKDTPDLEDTPTLKDNQNNENIFIAPDAEVQSIQKDLGIISPLDPAKSISQTTDPVEAFVTDQPTANDPDAGQNQNNAGTINAPNNVNGYQNQQDNSITAIGIPSHNTVSEKLVNSNNSLAASTNENELPSVIVTDLQQTTDPAGNDNIKIASGITAGTIATNTLSTVSDASQTSKTASTNSETQTALNEQQTETEISELKARDAKLPSIGTTSEMKEMQPMDQPDVSMTRMDLGKHETGKIQKMSSKSSNLAQFFKGKYKAPKRKFNENSASIYKLNKPFYTVAAYFSPEFTEYARMASTSREISYIGGLSLTYNNARFVFEGGLEYNYTNDLGDYMVDMETYDSIGYYNEVGGFVPDPNNPGEVIFETNTVMVYDSVQHEIHEQTQNHYSYLQVPLLIGYQAVERGLFSAYIKAGPSFSFLLNKQEQTLDFYNPDATVNQIENYTPTRMNTSIQVLVSVRFKFQLNEKVGILAEPTYRYYLKSVYDNSGNTLKNPYGIGVRCGLYFDL